MKGDTIQYKVEAPSPITLTGNDSICGGDEVTLTAPDGYSSYSWSNGEDTRSITVNPYGTTIYTVTADGNVFSRAVTVLQLVTIYGNAGANSTELVFDVNPVPGAHYEWKLGENVIPDSDTNVVTVSSDVTGSPKCYVTVTLGHCSVSDSAKIATVVKARDLCHVTTVTDHEGNRYNVVAFENTPDFTKSTPDNYKNLTQCWTKENMRAVTSPSTGTYLITNVYQTGPESHVGKIACWLYNDSLKYSQKNFGVQYNWNAAFDVYNRNYGELDVNLASRQVYMQDKYPRGICPAGWHVSRYKEWTSIEAVISNTSYSTMDALWWGNFRSNNSLGNKMATGVWIGSDHNCLIGDETCVSRNISDLSILPARTNNEGSSTKDWTYFWASDYSYGINVSYLDWSYASYLQLQDSYSGPSHAYDDQFLTMSVRCVKNYNDDYFTNPVVLSYLIYQSNPLVLGFATNPAKPVKKRGVIYRAAGQSDVPLEIADRTATELKTTDPDHAFLLLDDNAGVDKNFEITFPNSANVDVRGFLIYDDDESTIVYGDIY